MLYAKYNFASTMDWAIDLQDYTVDENDRGDDPEYGTQDWQTVVGTRDKTACTSQYGSLDQLEKDSDKIPADCVDKYLVDVEAAILGDSLDSCDNLIKGSYNKKFTVYEKLVKS